ncbi:MAG TPA: AAA family ATPase, partial [Candidatus Methylomirabilis sp.]|nr:AAA family ATPase [Candidatus Methylomirabilis sp.]
ELTRSSGELRERGFQLERRTERLRDELAAARREADELAARRGRLLDAHRQTAVQLSLLTAELAELDAERARCEERRARQHEALAELRVTLAARESAREALARLEREREGYGAGVRAIFSDGAGVELTGVVGTVADLLEVPPGLETAVEAVLGDRLQWVVVERFEQARAALGYLGREGAGAATLLPLETLPAPLHLPEESQDVSWAARLIGGSRPELVSYLLGRVGLVSHLDQAEHLWRRNGVVATYVTPSGEVLGPTGRLTGGRRDSERQGNDQSILGRKRALRQLEEELDGLRRDVEHAAAELGAVEMELGRLAARHDGLQSSRREHETARLAGQKDVESVEREEERVRRHLETLGAEAVELDAERAETERHLDELEGSLAAARDTEARLDRETVDLGSELDGHASIEAGLVADVTACRVDLASVSERVDALGRDIDRLGELGRDFAAQSDEAARRRAQVSERREDLNRERARTDAQARDASVERDRWEAELAVVAEAHRDRMSQAESIDGEIRQAQQALTGIVREIHELELRETEGRVRREELFQEARRRHAVEDEEALASAHDASRDLDEVRSRHGELTAKIEAMGLVNLVADEEYRELEERLDFLRTQHDDVVASIKDLERALKGMTHTAQERFQDAFDDINRHFGAIFSRLFEGGRAELRMVPPEEGEDDPLELGVELMAQPRGKRLQAVTLMSGGEKALTGLALLFAIFYHRPSPFCVLDEVDAPLDDANIHRFLRVLRELTSQTQFVVITHNRKTMDAADVLYGVTMEEPGLSRLVSVRLTEA